MHRVMTDNGPCFISDRFRDTCRARAIKHIRTRIYTPRTNGKAERFIQTAIREWAMQGSIKTLRKELHNSTHGLTSTTGTGHMLASIRDRPSAEPDPISMSTIS